MDDVKIFSFIVTSCIVDPLTMPHDWRNSQLRCAVESLKISANAF